MALLQHTNQKKIVIDSIHTCISVYRRKNISIWIAIQFLRPSDTGTVEADGGGGCGIRLLCCAVRFVCVHKSPDE